MQGLCIVKSLGAIKVPFKSLELNERLSHWASVFYCNKYFPNGELKRK